jgi:hypothetical protein
VRYSRAFPSLGHDDHVRTQESRDDKTVAIATALGIFVLLLAVGSLLLWAITLSDPSTNPMYTLVIAAAALAAVVFLVRHRKR